MNTGTTIMKGFYTSLKEKEYKRDGGTVDMEDRPYEDLENGAYFYDFYFDKNGYLFKTEGIEGIMLNIVEELYTLHYQYHKKIKDIDYVPVGSVLGCTYGSILARLNSQETTAVYVGNGAPVMTCSDCKTGENIPTFGTCRCPSALRMGMPGRRSGTYGKAKGPSEREFKPTGYKCIPLIEEGWKQPGEERVLIWRPSGGGQYHCALKSDAILVCLYGGTIGVVEVDSFKYLEEISNNLFVQKAIWDFFKEKQFTDEQVAGIMGNAMQESTFNPLRRGSGPYWGLFQLNKEASLELEKRYKEAGLDMDRYGYNVDDHQGIGEEEDIPRADLELILEIQLTFVDESEPAFRDWKSALKTASTVYESAENFLVNFEYADTDERVPKNQLLYYKYDAEKPTYFQDAKARREYAKICYERFSSEK